MIELPLRAKNEKDFPQLKKTDKDIVAYAVLMQTDNQTAFMRFHPEYMTSDGRTMNNAGKTESKHFWSYGKVKEYRESYERDLAEFLGKPNASYKPNEDTGDIDESRKDKALKALLNQAMGLVEGGINLDADSLKTISDIFTKLKLIKQEEEVQEKPRRYIPERCITGCTYRLFVESHIKSGDIIDECDYCKTRKFAEEKGWRFDATKNLELPINKDNEIRRSSQSSVGGSERHE